MKRIAAPNHTPEAELDYGKALITQKGGWTLAEFSKPLARGSGPTDGDAEEVVASMIQPDRALNGAEQEA